MNTQSKTKYYMHLVIVLGLVCFSTAVYFLPIEKVDFHLLVLFLFTIAVASRITIEFPRVKSHISVSDTFISLALLVYGGGNSIFFAGS